MGPRAALARSFFARDPREVAPELLNRLLVANGCAGRIVEVEAYCGSEDPASHAFRGPTRRNATMFGPPGHLYVYLSYGVHHCANVVCQPEGVAGAVLLRALAPLSGFATMRKARQPPAGASREAGRPPRSDLDLTSGPGRLCQALGITLAHDGADLVTGDQGARIVSDGTPPPACPAIGPRVGITVATEAMWRWWDPEDPNVSGRARRGRRLDTSRDPI